AFFDAMRPGAYFINTARAEIVDQPALEEAVRRRGLRAGLDVFEGEPSGGSGAVDAPIFRVPGVIGTHHIGASTDQAQEAIAAEAGGVGRAPRPTGQVPTVATRARNPPATPLLVARHISRVGVLAAVFDRIQAAGINVQETENVVFDGARAAVARIHLSQAPSAETIAAIRKASDAIIDVSLVAL